MGDRNSEQVMLSELQRDAINELLNMGVGRATAVLSKMVDEEIHLSVPSFEFRQCINLTEVFEGTDTSRVTILRQRFRSEFSGDALVIFPQERSYALVQAVMRENIAMNTLGELEQEALTEIGNIILNACIASLCNNFGIEAEVELTEFLQIDTEEIFPGTGDEGDGPVMFLKMDFRLDVHDVGGYLAVLLSADSQQSFISAVDRFIRDGSAG